MSDLKLKCGHKLNTDLDIFCTNSNCNRMYIPAYIPYIISVILLTIIFFQKVIIGVIPYQIFQIRPFLLVGLIDLFLLFMIISALRHRIIELLFCIFTVMPFLVIYSIINPIIELPISQKIDFILSISLLIQFSSFIFALIYGLFDARKYAKDNGLHSGSFWITLAFIISVVLTLFEIELNFLVSITPETSFRLVLNDVLSWTKFIGKYRTYLIAIVSALVIVLSTIESIRYNLVVKKVELYEFNINFENNLFTVFIKNIFKLVLSIIEIIATVSKVTLKILTLIGIEILEIFKDLIFRTLMLMLRLIRFVGVIFFTTLFYNYSIDLANKIDFLWNSTAFYEPNKQIYFSLLISLVISMFCLWSILMLSYRKWKLFEPENLTFKYSFALIFGKWNELQVSIKSITYSSMMYPTYILLSFLGAWAIINSILYFVNDNISSVGILFVSSISVIISLGAGFILIERIRT